MRIAAQPCCNILFWEIVAVMEVPDLGIRGAVFV